MLCTQFMLSMADHQTSRGHFGCGVTTDLAPMCWGDDPPLWAMPHGLRGSMVRLSKGVACALRSDPGVTYQHVACWGQADGDMLTSIPKVAFTDVRSGSSRHAVCPRFPSHVCHWMCATTCLWCVPNQFGVGETFGCGIRANDTMVQCWGSDAHGESTPPNGGATPYSDVAVGDETACGIRQVDGRVECWGKSLDHDGSASFQRLKETPNNDGGICGQLSDGSWKCFAGAPPAAMSSIYTDIAVGASPPVLA